MLRRDFLKTSVLLLPLGGKPTVTSYGWLPPILPNNIPRFLDTYPCKQGIGKGRVVLLYKYIESILKESLPPHLQKGPDCTSQAGGIGLDILQAIQVVLKKDKWIGKTATEVLHIGSRLTIGGRRQGGVRINELVLFLMRYGILFRKKYINDKNTFNFENYDYGNCIQLGKNGIPNWLLEECKKHQVIKVLKISSWNEARDAIRNLHPIVIGSDVGFDNAKRDSDGFAKPKGRWFHAWALIGIDDRHKRPGGCLISSHGRHWIKGPKRHKQPDGSIWVDKDVLEEMITKYGDSYAFCKLDGLTPVEYNLWS